MYRTTYSTDYQRSLNRYRNALDMQSRVIKNLRPIMSRIKLASFAKSSSLRFIDHERDIFLRQRHTQHCPKRAQSLRTRFGLLSTVTRCLRCHPTCLCTLLVGYCCTSYRYTSTLAKVKTVRIICTDCCSYVHLVFLYGVWILICHVLLFVMCHGRYCDVLEKSSRTCTCT